MVLCGTVICLSELEVDHFDHVFYISDINECDQVGFCLHGQCRNTDGSFRCVCDAGYTLSSDGTYCAGTRMRSST